MRYNDHCRCFGCFPYVEYDSDDEELTSVSEYESDSESESDDE
jgi:hypothetical protein